MFALCTCTRKSCKCKCTHKSCSESRKAETEMVGSINSTMPCDAKETTPFTHSIDTDLNKHHKSLENFNFIILFFELLLILPLLMGVQALIVATYILLPAPVTEVPVNILNMLQLTLIIGGALITYKLFQFEAPLEHALLQSFVRSYGGNNDSYQFAEVAGQILAEALNEMKNNSRLVSNSLHRRPGKTSQAGNTLTTSAEIHDSTN